MGKNNDYYFKNGDWTIAKLALKLLNTAYGMAILTKAGLIVAQKQLLNGRKAIKHEA